MDSARPNRSILQPKTLAELLPELSGILTKEAIQTLTARKQPRKRTTAAAVSPRIIGSSVKPKTIAEMQAEISALKPSSSRGNATYQTSAMKKKWNSSVKVEKKFIVRTGNGTKFGAARKVLDFQTKSKPEPIAKCNSRFTMTPSLAPKPVQPVKVNSRMTVVPSQPSKFVKPDKRTSHLPHPLQANNSVRISGVYKIPETPILRSVNKYPQSRHTIANKENMSRIANTSNKFIQPTRFFAVPDTPLSNTSSDASFLQREREIKDIEQKVDPLLEGTLENIAEVSPPISTPFKDYRSVQDYFNESSDIENSAVCMDNTIMCFDVPATHENNEDTVILSLCNLLNKAKVTTSIDESNKELNKLLENEKDILNTIKLLECGLGIITKAKETQEKSLRNIQKLIEDVRRCPQEIEDENDTTIVEEIKITTVDHGVATNLSVVQTQVKSPCVKSPSYKIPRKNMCLRKKVFHKSMPTVFDKQSPELKLDNDDRAMSMYLKMKEQMNFLCTPVAKKTQESRLPTTPAIRSFNLKMQLDKLYNNS